MPLAALQSIKTPLFSHNLVESRICQGQYSNCIPVTVELTVELGCWFKLLPSLAKRGNDGKPAF